MVIASLIIPTFNRNISVNACISSILKCKLDNIEIIIVNDYKEGSVVLSEENKSSLIHIVNNPKKGVASARNYGANQAHSFKLIFVDDDMIVNRETILKSINFLDTTKKKSYNANWDYEKELLSQISKTQFGRYLIHYNFTSLKGWNNNTIEWKDNALIKSKGITSQFFAIKKEDFDFVGGYNESFPFAGFEDYELNIKLKEKGIENYIDTEVLIYHNEFDRVNVINWMQRQKRGAQTRKVAVNMGFSELEINYRFGKRILYFTFLLLKIPIMFWLKIIPNKKKFDVFYFKCINILLGVNIYEGYHRIK